MFYFQSRGAVLGNNFISSVVAIPGHWSEHHPLRGQRQAAHLPGHRQVGPSSAGGGLCWWLTGSTREGWEKCEASGASGLPPAPTSDEEHA